MLIIPPPQFRKHRGRRSKTARDNQIVLVSHDTVSNRLIVIVNAMLGDMGFAGIMQVSADGVAWVSSIGGNFNNPPQVLISFPSSIVAKTQWRILDPSVWVFEDGRPLMPPYFGAIA